MADTEGIDLAALPRLIRQWSWWWADYYIKKGCSSADDFQKDKIDSWPMDSVVRAYGHT